VDAVLPDLVGKFRLVHLVESEGGEELRPIGQGEHLPQAEFPGLLQASLDQAATDSVSLVLTAHGQRPDLREVDPADVQGGQPHDPSLRACHHEIPDVLVEVEARTRQQVAASREVVEDRLHGLHILEPSPFH